MADNLINVQEYLAFTFVSTSHALKAEKVIKSTGIPYLMIPTPRQISTSCGLAVKTHLVDLKMISQLFAANSVKVEAIYQISKENGQSRAERVENA